MASEERIESFSELLKYAKQGGLVKVRVRKTAEFRFAALSVRESITGTLVRIHLEVLKGRPKQVKTIGAEHFDRWNFYKADRGSLKKGTHFAS